VPTMLILCPSFIFANFMMPGQTRRMSLRRPVRSYSRTSGVRFLLNLKFVSQGSVLAHGIGMPSLAHVWN
jgi:hypothetical protein